MDYCVQLEVFEGPLDLLLHLVRKHELDILDIPIGFISEKYVEYLDLMTALNLDVAGEYLVMAATLALIKSRELLPPDPSAEEDEEVDEELVGDPRGELIRRLLAYQKYKDAAHALGERPVVGRNVWGRGGAQEEVLADEVNRNVEAPLAEIPVHRLLTALKRVFERARISLAHEVSVARLSVSERINQLIDKLHGHERLSFFACFDEDAASEEEFRANAIVTFLAVLEMARLQLIRITQHKDDEDLWLRRREAAIDAAVEETNSYEYD